MGWKDRVFERTKVVVERETAEYLTGQALTALGQAMANGDMDQRIAAADAILRALPVVAKVEDLDDDDSDDEEDGSDDN